MRLLLDTHILIWLMEGDSRLSLQAHTLIDGAEEVFASSASIWEIAIKARLGKIKTDPEKMTSLLDTAGVTELPVSSRHAAATAKLPLLHRDPFDRLLIA